MSSLAELADLVADEPWRADAYCLVADPEIFHPEKGESVEPAKRVCARCPVTAECLEAALAVPSNHDSGIWGGLSFREREQVRRDRGLMGEVPWGFAKRGAA